MQFEKKETAQGMKTHDILQVKVFRHALSSGNGPRAQGSQK